MEGCKSRSEVSYPRDKKNLSYDSFIVRSSNYEQSMERQVFYVFDEFLAAQRHNADFRHLLIQD